MIQRHWDISSTFEHYGSGDFEMLGWDALRSEETLRLFRFEEIEARGLREQLLNAMPAELYALTANEPVSVQTMQHILANKTAARFMDLDETVLELVRAREFDILDRNGKLRPRNLRRLRAEDWISMPKNVLLPGTGRPQ